GAGALHRPDRRDAAARRGPARRACEPRLSQLARRLVPPGLAGGARARSPGRRRGPDPAARAGAGVSLAVALAFVAGACGMLGLAWVVPEPRRRGNSARGARVMHALA